MLRKLCLAAAIVSASCTVFGAHLRITSLRASQGPGVEFLEYLSPRSGRASPSDTQSNDLWSWQIIMRTGNSQAVERSLRESHIALVSSSTVHLGDNALDWRDALIARDPDGHTTLISGPPVQRRHTTSEQ